MGKNAGYTLTYKNTDKDPEDVLRVQQIEANFQPKSLNSFPANPDVKQLLNRQLGVVDDGTDRYVVLRIGDTLYRVGLTTSGDFVQIEGDTMTGQLTSTVASGAPPFVVASPDVVDTLNVDQVDGFDLDQSVETDADVTFESLTLTDLTASRLTATDGSKLLVSVAALSAWVAGTVNQITITDDGDGTITISAPQDIHTGASPVFVGLALSGLTASRLMATDGAKAAESVAALTSWIAGTANEITVTDDGDGTVTLSLPSDITLENVTITGPLVFEPDAVSVTAAGGITVTATHMRVSGDGGPIDITANPQIAAGTDGQFLLIEGGSDTDTVKLDNGDGLHLHGGSYTLRNHDHILMSYDTATGEWQEVARGTPASEKAWHFVSQSAGSGTNYFGGFYIFNSGDDDFSATQTLGVANASYAAHGFLVLGANTVDDVTIRFSGTSVDDEGNRTGTDTEDVVFTHPAVVDNYVETTKKWIGQVDIDLISGTAVTCNWGYAKYWDNNNTDFIVLGLEATWRGGANDNDPDLQLLHHKDTGWTFNVGAEPTPPTALASMKTDHTPEYLVKNNVPGAWKRTDLNVEVNGGNDEGTIICMVTNQNKAFELGNFLLRIRPN